MKKWTTVIVHLIAVLVLGIGAFAGWDANETQTVTQVLTAVVTAIVAAIPVVLHAFAVKKNPKNDAEQKKHI